MKRIRKRKFEGNSLVFWVLCMSGIFIPFALLYLIENVVETEVEPKIIDRA